MSFPRQRDLYPRDPARLRMQLAREQLARDEIEAKALPLTWNIIANEPQTWALCKKLPSGRWCSSVARVTRQADGTWSWVVHLPRQHGLSSASRNEAMVEAEQELARIEKPDTES